MIYEFCFAKLMRWVEMEMERYGGIFIYDYK